jgi:EpsI family protein
MNESSSLPAPSRALGVKQLAWIVAILAVTVVLTALTSDVTKASEPGIRLVNGQPYLPDAVGAWSGGPIEGLSEAEKRVLPQDTAGIRRRYTTTEGGEVTCSVVAAGRDVTSIHRPELCLPGQGWNIQREAVETIRGPGLEGGRLDVMRMDSMHTVSMTAPGRPARALFVYWFVGKDRVTPHHWERIFWTTKDRVFQNRNHRWAYILIASPVRAEQDADAPAKAQEATMKVLGGFIEQLYPMLRPLPQE